MKITTTAAILTLLTTRLFAAELPTAHTTQQIEGWTVHVREELLPGNIAGDRQVWHVAAEWNELRFERLLHQRDEAFDLAAGILVGFD